MAEIPSLERIRKTRKRRKEAQRTIAECDEILSAWEVLKKAGIVSENGDDAAQETEDTSSASHPDIADPRIQRQAARARARGRDEVLFALRKHFSGSVFTAPEVDPYAPSINRRSVKRVLDDLAKEGLVEIVEQGYKRKPSKYRLKGGTDEAHTSSA